MTMREKLIWFVLGLLSGTGITVFAFMGSDPFEIVIVLALFSGLLLGLLARRYAD